MQIDDRVGDAIERAIAAPAPPRAAGGLDVQLVRTVPEGIYDALPRGDFRILEGYVGALRGAERLVYLESQFLWSPEIVAILAKKLREPPTDGFRVVVLLPARPNDGADDTRGQLGVLPPDDRRRAPRSLPAGAQRLELRLHRPAREARFPCRRRRRRQAREGDDRAPSAPWPAPAGAGVAGSTRRRVPRRRERDLLAPHDPRRRDPPPAQRLRRLPAHGRLHERRARGGRRTHP